MEAEEHMDRPDFPTMEQVEKATHEQLARWYRFLPSGDTKEQQKIQDRIAERFKELGRRVSTTLRQVLTKFSEFFVCWIRVPSFPQEISLQDRLATTIGKSVDPQHPHFCSSGAAGSDAGVEIGLLIQTSLGRAGGLGALRTKRSG